MSEINIKINIRPHNDSDVFEWSKSNKKGIEVIEKITKELNSVDIEKFRFDFQITTK